MRTYAVAAVLFHLTLTASLLGGGFGKRGDVLVVREDCNPFGMPFFTPVDLYDSNAIGSSGSYLGLGPGLAVAVGADGSLYVASGDITRYDRDGPHESYGTTEPLNGIGVGADGTIAALSENGRLYRGEAGGSLTPLLLNPECPTNTYCFGPATLDVSPDGCMSYYYGSRWNLCEGRELPLLPIVTAESPYLSGGSRALKGGGYAAASRKSIFFYDANDHLIARMDVPLSNDDGAITSMSFDESSEYVWITTPNQLAKVHLLDAAIVARARVSCAPRSIGVVGETRPTIQRIAQLAALQIPATSHTLLALLAAALVAVALMRQL
jgi:hypothetical protein